MRTLLRSRLSTVPTQQQTLTLWRSMTSCRRWKVNEFSITSSNSSKNKKMNTMMRMTSLPMIDTHHKWGSLHLSHLWKILNSTSKSIKHTPKHTTRCSNSSKTSKSLFAMFPITFIICKDIFLQLLKILIARLLQRHKIVNSCPIHSPKEETKPWRPWAILRTKSPN
jgi:hypothetical protein